jgi:hypothetical protein
MLLKIFTKKKQAYRPAISEWTFLFTSLNHYSLKIT